MEVVYSALLALGAFWLGACPFSVWVGQWFLNKNIRDYGDGNPGSANVFRAGGWKHGSLALILDIAKGVPFVFTAHSLLRLPDLDVAAIGLSAILGHAFSPLLRFKGGKSVAVTYGVVLATMQSDLLVSLAVFMVLGFLFIEIDAWTVIVGPAGSLAYLVVTGAPLWEKLFIVCLLAIFVVKHINELKVMPAFGGRLVHWLQSRRPGV